MPERHGLPTRDFASGPLAGMEPNIEPRAARYAVAYRYAGAMRPDDLHNDRQAQSGTVSTYPLAAPEALINKVKLEPKEGFCFY